MKELAGVGLPVLFDKTNLFRNYWFHKPGNFDSGAMNTILLWGPAVQPAVDGKDFVDGCDIPASFLESDYLQEEVLISI